MSIKLQKTSISFFSGVAVRSVWDEENSKWWCAAMDIIEALTKSKNPRVYWATIKRRNPQLIAICKQLKLKAKDGRDYEEAGGNEYNAEIRGKRIRKKRKKAKK